MGSLLACRRARQRSDGVALGIDLRAAEAYVVRGERRGAKNVAVTRALRVELENGNALVQALEREGIAERDAVIAFAPSDVRTGPLPNGTLLERKHHTSSAEVYAEDLIQAVPNGDERIARLVVHEGKATIVATLASAKARTLARAEQLGLHVVAIDAPGLAWLRVAPQGIAVLGEGAMVVAPTETGLFSQHIGADAPDVTASIVQILANARGRYGYAGDTIATNAPEGHPLYHASSETRFEPLTVEAHLTPPWALAYGLLRWSLA